MKLWKDFYNHVMPHVPGATGLNALVDHILREATIEFFERSQCWREQIADIAVAGALSTVTSAAVAAGDIVIPVDDISGFSDGDSIVLTQTDGTLQRTTVDGVPGGGNITIAVPLTVGMDDGAQVQKVTDVYAMPCPTGTVVADVTDAKYNGVEITPIIDSEVKRDFPRPCLATPTRYNLSHDETIRLYDIPVSAGVLSLELALKPASDAANVPDWVFERHRKAIAEGAIYMLMAMPRKPYSNATLAPFHQSRFDEAIAAAEVRRDQGNTKAPMRVKGYSSIPLDDD